MHDQSYRIITMTYTLVNTQIPEREREKEREVHEKRKGKKERTLIGRGDSQPYSSSFSPRPPEVL